MLHLCKVYYELKAVIHHHGTSASSGHYDATVRYGDRWFVCTDESVTPVTSSVALRASQSMYLCVYSRKRISMLMFGF